MTASLAPLQARTPSTTPNIRHAVNTRRVKPPRAGVSGWPPRPAKRICTGSRCDDGGKLFVFVLRDDWALDGLFDLPSRLFRRPGDARTGGRWVEMRELSDDLINRI